MGKSKEYKLVKKITDKQVEGDVNWVQFTELIERISDYNLQELLIACFERLDSQKAIARFQVVELLDFLVMNGPIEWHEMMVQNGNRIEERIKTMEIGDTRLALIYKTQNWAAMQSSGPFADGYKAIWTRIAALANIAPVQFEALPQQDPNLSKMRVAQEITAHSDLVMSTSGLFIETLNFNQGYIGNNDLARDLHTQCKELKYKTDQWLQRTDLNEALTALLLQCADVLSNAFSVFADIVAQSNLIKAQEEVEMAQKRLKEAQELKLKQDAEKAVVQGGHFESFDPAQVYQNQSSSQYASTSYQHQPTAHYAADPSFAAKGKGPMHVNNDGYPYPTQEQQNAVIGGSQSTQAFASVPGNPFDYASSNQYPSYHNNGYQTTGFVSKNGDTNKPSTFRDPFQAFESSYPALNQSTVEYSSLSYNHSSGVNTEKDKVDSGTIGYTQPEERVDQPYTSIATTTNYASLDHHSKKTY